MNNSYKYSSCIYTYIFIWIYIYLYLNILACSYRNNYLERNFCLQTVCINWVFASDPCQNGRPCYFQNLFSWIKAISTVLIHKHVLLWFESTSSILIMIIPTFSLFVSSQKLIVSPAKQSSCLVNVVTSYWPSENADKSKKFLMC